MSTPAKVLVYGALAYGAVLIGLMLYSRWGVQGATPAWSSPRQVPR